MCDLPACRAYVLNELENCLNVLHIDPSDGTLSQDAKVVTYEVEGATAGTRQYGSGIDLAPDGKTLYVSNRGDGAILVFSVLDESPFLKQIQGSDSFEKLLNINPSNGIWRSFISIQSAFN